MSTSSTQPRKRPKYKETTYRFKKEKPRNTIEKQRFLEKSFPELHACFKSFVMSKNNKNRALRSDFINTNGYKGVGLERRISVLQTQGYIVNIQVYKPE